MTEISIMDSAKRSNNLLFIQSELSEISIDIGCRFLVNSDRQRSELVISCPSEYAQTVRLEIADRIAEIIAINYKYEFFKRTIKIGGLTQNEKELLFAGLIAADLEEDKRYSFEKLKGYQDFSIDGIFNFRMQPLKKKWMEVTACIPNFFVNSQLKEFIGYLLENKRKKIYVDGGIVYDVHYKRLLRTNLLDGENLKIIREILLSNCGEVELSGNIPSDDEFYIKEFYADRVYFR